MTNEAQEDATDQQDAVAADAVEPTLTTSREPVRARRSELRRVNGQYELWMGNQLIQSFCSQFENITRYAIPEGTSQQVRVNIEPLGEVREVATDEGRDRMSEFAEGARVAGRAPDPPALAGAVERAADLSEASVGEMEIELPDRGEPSQERVQGLLRVAEQVTNFGRGPDRPPSWRDDLRAQLQRESTSLRMMLDFLERM